MTRIKINIYPNTKSYSIIQDYKRNGKRTTRVVDNIGNHDKVLNLATNEGITVTEWLNNYLSNFLKEHGLSKEEVVVIEKYANKIIPANTINKLNVGYLFLKDIYYSINLNLI